MVPAWGTTPWRIDEAPRSGPPPERCDAAVVGAGLTGLSAAFHLARSGRRVAVLEAGRIGGGASGRTGAIVLEGTAFGPLEEVDDCVPGLDRLVRELAIDCALDLRGCREVGHRPRGAGGERAWRDGTDDLVSVGMVPGGTVDAGALVGGLARAAARAGATLHEGARVRRLEPGTTVALDVGDLRVRAGAVVLALNAWTASLAPAGERLRTALTLALATEPLDEVTLEAAGLADRIPFYTIDLPYLWGQCRPDGRAIFGAGLCFAAAGDLESVDVGEGEARDALERLEHRVRRLRPELGSVRIAHRWGGPIAIPAGRPPLLGRWPEGGEVIVTGGYAGHGVALAVRAGELAARAIGEGRPLPAWGALDSA